MRNRGRERGPRAGNVEQKAADMLFIGVKRFCVVAALSVSAIFAAYDAWLFLLSRTPDAELFNLHNFVLTTLVATWVVADIRAANRARPSFDHGWFIFVAFLFYVPYYLIFTRRWRRGFLILGVSSFCLCCLGSQKFLFGLRNGSCG